MTLVNKILQRGKETDLHMSIKEGSAKCTRCNRWSKKMRFLCVRNIWMAPEL